MIDFLEKERERMNVAGIGVAISTNKGIEFFSAGYSDIKERSIIDESSIFDIASIGKLFTSVAILVLIEKGHLKLETKISNILEDCPKPWAKIEIRHLLTHTSGLKNYTDTKLYWEEVQKDVSVERILEYILDAPLNFASGTQFHYCNTGYFLLGLIIEKLSNESYFQFVQSNILEKCNVNIHPTDNRIVTTKKVVGYIEHDGYLNHVEYYSNSGTFSAGGFSCALNDFLEFEKRLFHGEIISKEYVNLLIQSFQKPNGETLHVSNHNFSFEMGHGLFIFNGNSKKVAHAGNIKGFSSSYMRMLEDDLAIIVSINTDNKFEIHNLADEIYDLYKRQLKD